MFVANTRTATINPNKTARRANSFISPPHTRVAPVEKIPISATEKATGPVKDVAIVRSGPSQGSAPPVVPASAIPVNERKANRERNHGLVFINLQMPPKLMSLKHARSHTGRSQNQRQTRPPVPCGLPRGCSLHPQTQRYRRLPQ